jgi:uncharacterized protein YicC (UPF0701 family)
MTVHYDQRDKVPDDWSVLPLPEVSMQALKGMNLTRETVEHQARELARTYLETGDITLATVETATLWIGHAEPRIDQDLLLDYRDLITEMSKKVEARWSPYIDTTLHPENPSEPKRADSDKNKDAYPTSHRFESFDAQLKNREKVIARARAREGDNDPKNA